MSDEKYSLIVETMKHMYESKKLSISQIKALYNKGTLSLQEYNHILGKAGD